MIEVLWSKGTINDIDKSIAKIKNGVLESITYKIASGVELDRYGRKIITFSENETNCLERPSERKFAIISSRITEEVMKEDAFN